jgi:ABC-type branched-subunit amino acid transport system substrate-binding protein
MKPGQLTNSLTLSVAACVMLLLFMGNAGAQDLSASFDTLERHGKEVYLTGNSPLQREIKAFIGVAGVEAPGSAMPCVNCHGSDGRGRPESDITPSNIQWSELTKPYNVQSARGRIRPPYSEATLVGAITKGVDAAGNKLDHTMPVYTMEDEDVRALVAYLKHLGTELDPGLAGRSIVLGTILPSQGDIGQMGDAIKRTLEATFAAINQKGGIYDRRLELVVAQPPPDRALTKEQMGEFLGTKRPFALVSTFTPGLDQDVPALVEKEGVPLVGPFTLFPLPSLSLNRFTFYIFPGLQEQVLALVDYAAGDLKASKAGGTTIACPSRADLTEVVDTVEKYARAKGFLHVSKSSYPPQLFPAEDLVQSMLRDNVTTLFFLGGENETGALLREAGKQNWTGKVLAPGVLVGRAVNEVPQNFKDRVYLAYPTLPEDRKEKGMGEFLVLSRTYGLPSTYLTAQLSAYAAAQILVEGLRRSGRELNREKLISAIERLYEFETGVTPAITYGPNRHVGSIGSYVVTVNPGKAGTKEFIASRKWVVPN